MTLNAAMGASFKMTKFELRVMPSFVDYLRSGWAISLVCAIDYTGSNGEPTRPDSLHFLGPNNQYENALNWVGSIVEPYDSDRSFPVFGFGGIPRHMGINQTSHCFALNGNPANPEIIGIPAILQTYRDTQRMIGLSGPTLFAPLLNEFLNYCTMMKETTQYNILLLLTDGIINDMAETKRVIVRLSELPVSIIIVGVGNADFSQMEELDGDGGVLRDDMGKPVVRDIVQFVRFNECVARGNLAEEVLKEVPT